MKRLTKFLSLFLLVVILAASFKAAFRSQNIVASGTCPILGNHMIDNIKPEVLVNLRTEYDKAKEEAKKKDPNIDDSCWISAAFLFRGPDLENATLLNEFFKTAKEQRIQLLIRVASDNSGDSWEAIGPETARKDAEALNSAIGSQFPSDHIPFAYFGNEPNLHNEWGGSANGKSFAQSFYAFASTATNFKVSFPPLSYCGSTEWQEACLQANSNTGNQMGVPPRDFLKNIYDELDKLTGLNADSWIKTNIDAYSFVVIGGDTNAVSTDFVRQVAFVSGSGFDANSKPLLISELGIPNGVYEPGLDTKLWSFYQALLATSYGSSLEMVTSFVRDGEGRVHAYYYITNKAGVLVLSGEYDNRQLNLGGSTSHGSALGSAVINGATFLPLGSVEVCPPEIKVDSKFRPAPPSPNNPVPKNSCQYDEPEPPICNNLEALKDTNKRGDFCNGPTYAGWCRPSSCQKITEARLQCGGGGTDASGCGKFLRGFCLGQGPYGTEDPIYKEVLACSGPDTKEIGYCWNYLRSLQGSPNVNTSAIEQSQGLPACVPTYNSAAKCVSECGSPIKFTESLVLKDVAVCITSGKGDCYANIGIKQDASGNNNLYVPYARSLADYFAGVMDVEHSNANQLDEFQRVLMGGVYGTESANLQTILDSAGVAKKLFPEEIQDKLKCEFISYVKDKIAKGENTKYAEKINGVYESDVTKRNEFMVYDKKITQIKCKPDTSDGPAYNAWLNEGWSKYWFGVPLFQNDEAQGKIEFASPTLSSLRATSGKEILGPIYVSVPDIARLDAASAYVQAAMTSNDSLLARQQDILDNPAISLPTFGKTIEPTSSTLSCTPKKDWNDYYSKDKLITDANGENVMGNTGLLTEYTRGVACDLRAISESDGNKICTVGKDGQIICEQKGPNGTVSTGVANFSETVQVRTVFPHLFDISEQTIAPRAGVFRLFKPETVKEINALTGNTSENVPEGVDFDKKFEPIPAYIENVRYELKGANGLGIDDTDNRDKGWKIFFYKLGGVQNAKEFLLDLLSPERDEKK